MVLFPRRRLLNSLSHGLLSFFLPAFCAYASLAFQQPSLRALPTYQKGKRGRCMREEGIIQWEGREGMPCVHMHAAWIDIGGLFVSRDIITLKTKWDYWETTFNCEYDRGLRSMWASQPVPTVYRVRKGQNSASGIRIKLDLEIQEKDLCRSPTENSNYFLD